MVTFCDESNVPVEECVGCQQESGWCPGSGDRVPLSVGQLRIRPSGPHGAGVKCPRCPRTFETTQVSYTDRGILLSKPHGLIPGHKRERRER